MAGTSSSAYRPIEAPPGPEPGPKPMRGPNRATYQVPRGGSPHQQIYSHEPLFFLLFSRILPSDHKERIFSLEPCLKKCKVDENKEVSNREPYEPFPEPPPPTAFDPVNGEYFDPPPPPGKVVYVAG